jgi:hypothetical protein
MRLRLALVSTALVGCAAAPLRTAAPAVAPTAARTESWSETTGTQPSDDPCGAASGLVLTPPETIPAQWDGRGLSVGGEAPLEVRWCGEGEVVVETVTMGPPESTALVRYDLDPDHGRLAHGARLTRMLRGWAEPQPLRIHVLARQAGVAIEADTETRTTEEPALVSARAECEAAHGTFGPVGMVGSLACTRPTRDAGQRCLSSAECEGACLEDHVETVDAAPDGQTCTAPETMRLHVGRCDTQVPRFGCAPRLSEVHAECVRPGMATRRSLVCVD